jgi:hypothetical protein
MKNKLNVNPIRNARKPTGGALGALFTAAVVLGGPFAHGTPVESVKPNAPVAEVGKAETLSLPPEQLYGIWTASDEATKIR